jgi:pimeloyl-[acyl-carrier protein] methyl ester esterase
MNSSIWKHCLQQLPPWINPITIDLPGYGVSAEVRATTLDDYVDHVARQISRPSLLVGWSLGGLVSLRLARRHPQLVLALFQLAASPRFVQALDWPCAIESSVFAQFAQSLQHDVNRTIRRFLALQVRGTTTSMQTVRQLQQVIDAHGLPGREALLAGLKILSETDLTAELQALECPLTWLLGDKDALVPVELADRLAQLSTNVEVQRLTGAGHAPMISHPDEFSRALLQVAEGLR